MRHTTLKTLLLCASLGLPAMAHAHPGHMIMEGWLAGLTHPLFGLDHLLAMLAVGLWGAQLGGRARWLLPVLFVVVMLVGGALGIAGMALPAVESGIVTSVLVLGLMLLWARQLPLMASASLVAVFALFHGHAHGTEMPLDAAAGTYAAGFALATAGLHLFGLGLGQWLRQINAAVLSRTFGALIGLAGVGMVLAG